MEPPLTSEEKYQLIRSIGAECIEESELKALIDSPAPIIAYDGFECSGRMHLSQGFLKMINVNKIIEAGGIFKFWVADCFAQMNHKLGGDLKKIRQAGELMIHTWRACGMKGIDDNRVLFLWAWEEINKDPERYWKLVLDISNTFSLNRMIKCTSIAGRSESDNLSTSQILYPAMQCADIFFLNVNLCQLGVDQRKVNMLAREYSGKIKKKHPPVILSHKMIMGLDGSDKMSKSNPDSAIFMDDPDFEVKRKIKKAYCKPGEVEGNPILEYLKEIIFPMFEFHQKESQSNPLLGNLKLEIIRKPEHGGNLTFTNYQDVEDAFRDLKLHPDDLKKATVVALNNLLTPIREYFQKNQEAKNLQERVKKFKITK